MRFEIFIGVIVSLCSCSGNSTAITTKEIDIFISKYEDVKFEEFRDISIMQRSSNLGKIVYVVGKSGGTLPVYFVTFDLQREKIADINKTNLQKSNIEDYLTINKITNAVNAIRKYNFYFLAIDSFQNVYINPFYANEPPYLLRLKTFIGDSVIKKGYAYEIYNKKWYLNMTRRRN